MKVPIIEPSISRRGQGLFRVAVRVQGVVQKASFQTIEEARYFRAEMQAQRPKRIYGPKGQDLVAADTRKSRQATRELLEQAPRSEVEREGRVFTVVHL